ncbi:MAG: hypothetical protein EA378_01880 [Phycisphaerales bacterium]|nr:MAG: hypothetical protein EA378_01880 [Phycisphaerales bacterium]
MRDRAGPFPPEAFQFVREGLAHTVETAHGPHAIGPLDDDESRHVSGQQLCLGIRDYAIDQFGDLAGTVLRHWGLRKTEDFGKIVFAMVDAGLMRTTDDDSIEDFRDVFDFDEAFASPARAGGLGGEKPETSGRA